MSNTNPGLNSNHTIRDAIQKIALHGVVDSNGETYTNKCVSGYVVKVHLDDDLAGTVDVKEYDTDFLSGETGHVHEGVLLSAIQGNTGLLIVPKLYSDVIIRRDSNTNEEFVTMFSHADILQLDAHDTVTIGVKEREDFDENSEDSPDINELEETGVKAVTTYKKDSVTTEVTDGEDNIVQHTIDDEKFEVEAGDDQTKLTLDQDGMTVVHDKSSLVLDDGQATLEQGNSKVKVTNGTTYVGSDTDTDDAVLGGELADVLSDILDYLSQATTTTMMGPQPLASQLPNFIAMKAKITAWKAAHSGFLTNKVLIQK